LNTLFEAIKSILDFCTYFSSESFKSSVVFIQQDHTFVKVRVSFFQNSFISSGESSIHILESSLVCFHDLYILCLDLLHFICFGIDLGQFCK